MSGFTIWGLTDGSAGMVSQVRGVGESLVAEWPVGSAQFILKSARRRKPFCWLHGAWHWGALSQLTLDSDALTPPYPDMLITSGRRSVALALAIRRASGGRTKLVHLQGPRVALHHFDLVVPMLHDDLHGENVIATRLALHHITDQKLLDAAHAYAPALSAMPSPRALFLLGGSTHAYALTADRMQRVVEAIRNFAVQHNGSLWISASRRTGAENIALLRPIVEGARRTLYAGEGENPYLSWLASADIMVVTNDSVTMMSEALFTGKPVYILPLPEHRRTKPATFAAMLMDRKLARPFTVPLEPYTPVKLDERDAVVEEIVTRFAPRD